MARVANGFWVPLAVVVVVIAVMGMATEGAVSLPKRDLIRQFYKKHNLCDNVEAYVKLQIKDIMGRDKSVAPKLARLLYSDCFITGCDASILLMGAESERKAAQNVGLGGFAVIERIKKGLEAICPGVVSCADILNLATRDAIHLAGGPSYIIRTGRRDGFSSKASTVDLPSPSISWQQSLDYFRSRDLDVEDMTTLLGLHSLGGTRCRYIMDRLYNYKGTGKADPSMDKSLLNDLKKKCPKTRKRGEHEGFVNMNGESGSSRYSLDMNYYKRVLSQKAILGVDQQLVYGNETLQLTQEYAVDGFNDYKLELALAMARMGEIGVLTGSQGEIRRDCRYTNS
ncbi:hypothetical protein V2J09_022755 [Rumex salicifolius]